MIVVDTSLLIRRINLLSPHHTTAVRALGVLHAQGQRLVIFPQAVYEFWAVATRPVAANGLGMSIADADAERKRLETLFSLAPDPPGLYARWVALVNQLGISGKPTHDARLAAAALELGLPQILTFNTGDFVRFQPLGLTALDPATVN